MGKNKQKGPGKGKKESAVFKVAGVRKPKIKSVNTNLKKVRGGVLHIIERQKVEFDINSFRVKLYCLDCVHHNEKNSLVFYLCLFISLFDWVVEISRLYPIEIHT